MFFTPCSTPPVNNSLVENSVDSVDNPCGNGPFDAAIYIYCPLWYDEFHQQKEDILWTK